MKLGKVKFYRTTNEKNLKVGDLITKFKLIWVLAQQMGWRLGTWLRRGYNPASECSQPAGEKN